jgi:hypothetical protein
MTARRSRDWDVVCGDGFKPVTGEQSLPEELLPKEKSSDGCEEGSFRFDAESDR